MKKAISNIYTWLVFAFLYAPIIVLIVFSFNATKSRTVWGGFSLKWYGQLFEREDILRSLYITLIVAVIASITATVIGTAAAIGINSMRRMPKKIVMNVNNIPIINPEIVTGVSLRLLFVFVFNLLGIAPQLGFTTLLLSHITFNIPYVILSVAPKLRQMDKHLYEAAQDLGCSPFEAFSRVTLPEIMPGVITGLIMAFTLSLDDFVISYFTSESEQVLSVTINTMLKKPLNPTVNALSSLLFVSVLILLVIINVRQSRDGRKHI